MRKLSYFLTAILVLVPLVSGAQVRTKTPSKKQLASENSRLRASVDSLLMLVDSLNARLVEEEEVTGYIPAPVDTSRRKPIYTAEQTDSLLSLWYEANRFYDFKALESYDMDNAHFVSEVSDAEIERRLKAMNAYITLPFNETVKNYIVLYSEKMRSRMGRAIGLADFYFPLIEDTFNRYDLPLELKYLAIVESMLSPTATSRVGAKGMWQFMYKTARAYGLQIDSFVDERMDVEKSVDAAARYLIDSYKIFGDWCLAISAYNCGFGNVQKAIRRAGGSTRFWDIYPFLPRETRGYMPAFVGAMYAMTYAAEYGIERADVGLPAQVDTFEIHKNLHFKQINEVVGIPMEDLENLNPKYYHGIVPGNGGTCVLNIPFSWSSAFLAADQDSLYKHKADELLSEQVLKNAEENSPSARIAYKVKSGDYLGRIASKYHVSVNQIMKWNHLRSSNLRAGQVLYIYKNGGPVQSSKTSPATQPKTAASSSATPSKAAEQGSTTTSGNYIEYIVKAGDSFYSIAKNYSGVSAQNIMDFNHLTSSNLRPGMKIKIPKE